MIGGSSVKECSRRIMRHIMTDKCARGYNWKGKGEKRAFCALTIKTIVNREWITTLTVYASGCDN